MNVENPISENPIKDKINSLVDSLKGGDGIDEDSLTKVINDIVEMVRQGKSDEEIKERYESIFNEALGIDDEQLAANSSTALEYLLQLKTLSISTENETDEKEFNLLAERLKNYILQAKSKKTTSTETQNFGEDVKPGQSGDSDAVRKVLDAVRQR